MDTAALRRTMVETQLRPNAVTDARVLDAMAAIPRERYVSAEAAALAYMEGAPAMRGAPPSRVLMPAMPFARLVQAARPPRDEQVLLIGAGSGYGAAVLAHMGARVVALDDGIALAERLPGVEARSGPLAAGWPDNAPYAAIIIEGAVEQVPAALVDQLITGGRLVAIERRGASGKGILLQRGAGGHAARVVLFDAAAPLLPGFALAEPFVF